MEWLAPTIASTATLLLALPALVVVLRTSRKTAQVTGKLDEVHVLVNSNLAAVKADLEMANARIEALQGLVASMQAKEKAP